MADQNRLLVTGASGRLGRRVLDHLLESYHVAPTRLIATTRTPEKLEALAQRGVEIRAASFDDSDTLTAAFAGASRALIISTDRVDPGGGRLAQHLAAVAAAEAAGVEHVVYTSMMNPGPDSPVVALAPDHYGTERALAESDLTATVLRNCWYTDFRLFSLPAAIATGEMLSAADGKGVVYVTREDCARTCAAALAADTNRNQTLDVTGPDAVSHEDLARIASALTGKPIRVIRLSDEALRQRLLTAGLPPPIADLSVTMDVNTRLGYASSVSDTVQRLTGTPPQSVRDFLAAHRAALG